MHFCSLKYGFSFDRWEIIIWELRMGNGRNVPRDRNNRELRCCWGTWIGRYTDKCCCTSCWYKSKSLKIGCELHVDSTDLVDFIEFEFVLVDTKFVPHEVPSRTNPISGKLLAATVPLVTLQFNQSIYTKESIWLISVWSR